MDPEQAAEHDFALAATKESGVTHQRVHGFSCRGLPNGSTIVCIQNVKLQMSVFPMSLGSFSLTVALRNATGWLITMTYMIFYRGVSTCWCSGFHDEVSTLMRRQHSQAHACGAGRGRRHLAALRPAGPNRHEDL